MNNSTLTYNPSITLIKLVAFVAIMLFHLQLFPLGSQGITIFVICSGYSYFYLYRKQRENDYGRSFSHQAKKLLLAVFLSYSVTVLIDSMFFHRYAINKIIVSYVLIFCGVFVSELHAMINYGFSVLGLNVQLPYFPSNGVLWFVSLVLWLYLLFPLLKSAVESRYRFIVIIVLLILSLVVRNYAAFRYPYNSISANLFNFYVGMLVFRYEKVILEKVGMNKVKTVVAVLIFTGVYVFYGWDANIVLTYGIMMFAVLYLSFGVISDRIREIGSYLHPLNSVIMFLVFLHIPAQSIRDVILRTNGHDDRKIILSYVVYFLYTVMIAVVTNKLYETVQAKLVSRFVRA